MDKESLEKIFIALDVGNDGFINKDELSKLCDHFGMEPLSNAELSKLYRNLDTDGDGKISKDEFFEGLFKKSIPSPTTSTNLNKEDKSEQRRKKVKESKNSIENELDGEINSTITVITEGKQSNSLKPNTLISLANKNKKKLDNEKFLDLEKKQHLKSKEISQSVNKSKQLESNRMSEEKKQSTLNNSTSLIPKSSTVTEEKQIDSTNIQKKPEEKGLLHTFDDAKFRPDPVIWLNFLDETRNGEIESDVVVEFWDDLGIPDGREVLKELKLKPNGKINVEELTKKLEGQLKKGSAKNSRIHSVAVVSLLHSADKLWKDNEEIVEECGRMDEELQRLKVNLKEADEVMSAMEEKRDSKVFEEAIQKLETENKEMKQKLLNVSEKYKETLECKQQSTQTNAKLNGENGIKIPKSLTSLPTKKSLHKDDYASFDFDNNDPPDEIRRKVREKMLRREELSNEERKDMEGALLLEVAEVEKNCESQLQKMKTQHEQDLADLKVSYARDLQDKLAEKEKEMMMEIVADKMKKKDEEGESVNELRIKQLEKELELKLNQLTGVVKDLETKNATIEKLKNELTLIEENKRERVFEEYEPKITEDEEDKSGYEEKIKNMQLDFDEKFQKLEDEYGEKIKNMQNAEVERKQKEEKLMGENDDYEIEMVKMKKKYDEEVMNAANKVNELEGRLAEMKSYLNSKETTNEKLKNEMNELKNGVKKMIETKDSEIQKLKNELKEEKFGNEGLQDKLKRKDKDYEEAVLTLEGELQKAGDYGINRTESKLQELDVALTEKDNEVLKLKKELRDLEMSKLDNLKQSKDIEDKLRRELTTLNMQHDQEMKFLQSQLKNALREPINESIKPSSSYKLASENAFLNGDIIEKSQSNELQKFYESKLEEVKNKAEIDKQRALKDKNDELELIKAEHELVIGSLKRERDRKEIEKEIENKRETSNMIEDLRRKNEQKIKQITLSTNKKLNDNLTEFAEQVGELKKSFSKLEQAKESELRDLKSENEGLHHEVESLKKSLQQANKIQPDSLTLDRTDVLAERDLLKDQLKQTLMQLNDVTTALTLLTNQHRADKSAWKQQASRLVDAGKLQETIEKLETAEQNNQRLQRLLEKSQSEVAKMLIANRKSFDKELRKMENEKDNNNMQMEKLRNIITDKNNIIRSFEEKQRKADVLAKDLYGENARVLKYLQSVEKERNDANNRVMSLEQKIACMGELIRSLCPAAIS